MKLASVKLNRLGLALTCLSVATVLATQGAAAQSLIDGTWNLLQDEDAYNFIAGLNAGPNAGDPYPGDFAGLPITPAARDVAQAFDEAQLEIPEMQCRSYATPLGPRAIGSMTIWEDRDPHTLQQTQIETMQTLVYGLHRHIWMVPQPGPPSWAAGSWAGYSTGKWVGNTLWVHTDHLKSGILQRGSDLPLDDQTTMDERFFRDGDVLTDVMFISDKQYLSRPYVNSKLYILAPQGTLIAVPCVPFDEVPRAEGIVPMHVPGYVELQGTVGTHIPLKTERGGSETEFPEYQEVMKGLPPNPSVDRLHKALEKEQAEEEQFSHQ
ncbi:MAG TPA: hypothetical protein VHY19_04345 [Steroidobacteraceae bacterium]|nr:hypothetical protein [Steroidobacteraceae bacterium]